MKVKLDVFLLNFSNIAINVVHLGYFLLKYLHFNIFFHKFKKEIIDETDILYSSFLFNWRTYKNKNGRDYKNDIMIGDVIEESKKRFNIKCMDSPTYFRSLEGTYEKFNESDDWICVEQFMDISNIFKAFYLSMKSSFGYGIGKDLDNYFSSINESVNVRSLLYLLTSEKIISKIEPKILFLTCEFCPLHRELTYIARLNNKTVIALQHGFIYPSQRHYIYTDDRIRTILPDITCVYGQYHYDLLTKHSIFKPDQVVVTGQPRYDVLYYAKTVYNKERFLNKYKINPNHKIVLWATQWGVETEEKMRDFKAIFKTMGDLENTTLVIKQHPLENEKDTKMLKDYLNIYKLNSIITPKKSDSNELLFACDLMITKNSTIVVEAIALNKPVIVLNLTGEPDIIDYVDQGVALGVYDGKDLKSAIKKLLIDDAILAVNRKKYIHKYLYEIDGKSTTRVVDLIDKMIKEKE